MLSSMRTIAHGFLAKALLMFLVITFAVWGVGDILRTSHATYVASVGGHKIPLQEFERELSTVKRQMQAAGLQQVQMAGLESQLLRQMIVQRLTDLRMHALGLSVGDPLLAAQLRKAPTLQNPDGTFNATAFHAFLQQRGLSEEGFLAQLRGDLESRTLLDSLDVSDMPLPASLTALQALAAGETRDAVLVTVPLASAKPQAASAQELKDFYEQQKGTLYLEPERRTLDYVTLSSADINALIDRQITDPMVKERFAAEKDRFGAPEKRHVQQLLITKDDDTKKAKALIEPGATLVSISRYAPTARHTDLGFIGEGKLEDEADHAVFAAKNGEIVGPFTSDFGQVFYQVVGIAPAKPADFDKAKAAVRTELRDEARDNALQDITNQVEDALAGGKTMSDALAAAGIKTETRSLKDVVQADEARTKDPLINAVMTHGFSLGEGETSGLAVAKDGTYFIVAAKSIHAAAPKPFEAAKEDIAQRLMAESQRDAVTEHAAALAATLKKSSDWQSVLTAQHLAGRTMSSIPRLGAPDKTAGGLPGPLVQAIFEHAPGEVAGPSALPNGDAMLAIVTGLHHNAQAQLSDAARKQFSTQLQDEVLEQYFNSLAQRYPVDVNQQLLANAHKDTADE